MEYRMEFLDDVHNPGAADALYQNALGAVMLDAVRNAQPEAVAQLAEQSAVQALQEIQDILNDETLSDSDCFLKIDSIVTLFYKYHLSTDRHIECE